MLQRPSCSEREFVVQIAPEDLLLVLPSWSAGPVQVLGNEVCAVGAALVTRERPLLLARLVTQVEGAGLGSGAG